VLEYGDSVDADSTESNPVVFFVFEGSEGDVVDIMVQSDEFPTLLHIFDPEGTHLGVDPSAITGVELPEVGLYLILATDAFFYDVLSDDTYFIGGNFVLSLDG
jgi:hypothetical protein